MPKTILCVCSTDAILASRKFQCGSCEKTVYLSEKIVAKCDELKVVRDYICLCCAMAHRVVPGTHPEIQSVALQENREMLAQVRGPKGQA